MPVDSGKFVAPYVLIIEQKVGTFNLWPIDQYEDALEEFAGKGAAVYAVPTIWDEIEISDQMGPAWEIVADAFAVVPYEEILPLGGRLGFCYLSSFEELPDHWEGVPEWSDLLRMSRN